MDIYDKVCGWWGSADGGKPCHTQHIQIASLLHEPIIFIYDLSWYVMYVWYVIISYIGKPTFYILFNKKNQILTRNMYENYKVVASFWSYAFYKEM